MRYFTRELWSGAQGTDDGDDNNRLWNLAFKEYREQLEALRSRLDNDAFEFFSSADIHDGELLNVQIVDGSRPAPISEPARPWGISNQYPVRVEVSILDAYDKLVWDLTYSGLRRVVIDYPSADPLFYFSGEGFGDLGYHELTDAGQNYLRHEVLFATGATLLFEFQAVRVTSRQRPWDLAQLEVRSSTPSTLTLSVVDAAKD